MLLKCTADGRRIKVNGPPGQHANIARGMKMTMSTTATMSARVHRKVMRAPHKRAHPGKMPAHPGKMAAHPGKMAAHSGKMASHSGNIMHPGKLSHFGRFGKLQHYAQTTHTLRPPEPCGDSNDSGLGPDHDQRNALNRLSESGEEWGSEPKRCRSDEDLKLESDDAIDAYTFGLPPPPAYPAPVANDSIRAGGISSPGRVPESPGKRFQDASYRSCGKLGSGKLATKYSNGGKLVGGKLAGGGKLGGKLGGKYGGKLAQALARRRALATMHGPPAMAAPITNRSRDGTVELQILCQPESQHRARYQTEGSRGAVKDNSGNGFPMVKLAGYDKPAVLQVYIGTDTGRVAPHMFYQACRVSGKNSTPCKERKEDGTVIIEIDLEPAKNWQVTCDCVGILKERNVDVEHRFGDSMSGGAHVSRGKKKSTRCRMVFRTDIINREGIPETLQVCSTQIICTQPPGVPEVCRKSLMSCPASGGLELYLLGKNFLKETRVVFSQRQDGQTVWEKEVIPDKEFLQQSHLVCCVPPYGDISEPVGVQLFVRSGGRASEPHAFYYTPTAMDSGPQHCTTHHAHHAHHAGHTNHAGHAHGEDARPVLLWGSGGLLAGRRGSLIVPDEPLKVELSEEGSRDVDAEGVVDLRLKSEGSPFVTFAEAMEPPSAPLVSFTQQLQAIQTQVQTDKMVESVTAAIFNTDDAGGPMYAASVMSAPADLGAHHGGHGGGHSTPEAKLDELVNARADDHLAGDEHVKTPPAAVKSMILTAAAEILTSDSTMNALVTSAMNTANILTEPAEPAAPPEAPLAACAAAVSAAVTQAVSQAVSHAVSHAVTQEMAAPVQRLTDMSDNDLLSYINPSAFDQV